MTSIDPFLKHWTIATATVRPMNYFPMMQKRNMFYDAWEKLKRLHISVKDLTANQTGAIIPWRLPMTKPNESDTIARLALGLVIFLAMRFAPRVIEAWQKRKEKAI